MRMIASLFGLVLLFGATFHAAASDAESIDAVNKVSAAIDQAFEQKDATAIKALMTQDHVAVTPYYDKPMSVAEQTSTLPGFEYKQITLSGPTVTLLSPDVALRTMTAKLEGQFKGKPLPQRVFITAILIKKNGAWLERFYQATELP